MNNYDMEIERRNAPENFADAYHEFWCLTCDGYINDHECDACVFCGTDQPEGEMII